MYHLLCLSVRRNNNIKVIFVLVIILIMMVGKKKIIISLGDVFSCHLTMRKYDHNQLPCSLQTCRGHVTIIIHIEVNISKHY